MCDKDSNLNVQAYFSENYDFKLALSLSKTEAELKKKALLASHSFEQILPPFDAFEVIKERLNIFYS